MLTDEVRIKVIAGRGGDGSVAFDKIKMALGPTGGRGGNGGNVYFEGVTNLSALNKYKHKIEHYAEDGKNGKGDKSDGHGGEDIILTVPVGSVIHNLTTGRDIDIIEEGKRILIAKGGVGGRGNFFFRSSTNTTPKEKEEGKPGEEFDLMVELRLIADVGLVGLPSAGKSSLLNELTKAQVKTGAYHFTTLEPNLGSMGGIIIADIPGLIEGASEGRGLGMKFLRHISRTKILFHCVSLESEDLEKDYRTIRNELGNYDKKLLEKKEVVLLTKSDLVDDSDIEEKIKKMRGLNPEIMVVSIHDFSAIEKLKEKIASSILV